MDNAKTYLIYPNPMDWDRGKIDAEMTQRYKNSNGPNGGRRRKSGDVYTIICAIAGAAIGGLVGGFFSSIAILGGIIAGGILGAVIYNLVKNQPFKKKKEKEEPPQSPFIS